VSTILHVEDDPWLAKVVRLSFDSLGFRGDTLLARTIDEARTILSSTTRYPRVDLVLSDMNLPDGTGLDVVRMVRNDPARAHVPVLILSGDTDPAKVDRAYALGANTYVAKMPEGRSPFDVLEGLYEHWLKDALLPRGSSYGRVARVLERSVVLHDRLASVFVRIAKQQRPEADFWMTLALRQGNLANLYAFVRDQHDELADDLLDAVEAYQAKQDRVVMRIERSLEQQPIRTPDDAYRLLREYVESFEIEPFARVTASLFPVVPMAMKTMVDFATKNVEDAAAWLEARASEPAARERIATLRAEAARLRALYATE